MLLIFNKSLCKKNAPIVITQDKGNSRKHRAINPDRKFDLRHYKLDGELFKNTKCCDFLLINDSNKKAYLIELKGKKIDDAVEQLTAGEQKCKDELKGYTFFYRIVCSSAKTHKIQSVKFRRFKEKHKPYLKTTSGEMEECLE